MPYSIPQPSEGVKWTVAFERPSEINLVGSWPNKIGVKAASGPAWMVDVALEMPAVRSLASSKSNSLTKQLCSLCYKKKITWMDVSFTSEPFILLL